MAGSGAHGRACPQHEMGRDDTLRARGALDDVDDAVRRRLANWPGRARCVQQVALRHAVPSDRVGHVVT